MRERMLAGELYIADDPELALDAERAMSLAHRLNTTDPTRDLPADVVAVGNPARVIRQVEP